MLKTILSFLALALFAVNCASFGKVNIVRDDFKNSHIVSMKLQQQTSEGVSTPFGEASWAHYYAVFDFSREIGADNKAIPSIVRFNIHVETEDSSLEKTGFIKIGDKTNPLIIANANSQMVTSFSSTTTTTSSTSPGFSSSSSNNASTGHKSAFVDFTKTNNSIHSSQTKTQTASHTHKELTGTFLLKKEDEQAILGTNQFTIRVYSGSKPLTFQFDEENIGYIKNFLVAKPGDESR
ncbi:hypothetical protein EHQ53_12580 [Leptospira langatensis]|uniref:Lipoprotein n=1 Tax=Leptospira langatensis TaxID=2484983 RepID=A0A5F1ZQQ0_9LEPT|nr:hypothetical protein [Leptospira langatensis]TGK02780.1 hypothetical protein EHO57_05530 [Leptospira langatensis]TGL40015.1 hypothetical protein EHQ53_12580 [Leptospira langatensis]